MFKKLLALSFVVLLVSCGELSHQKVVKVNNAEELKSALTSAVAGTDIVLANGVWTDLKLKFTGTGTEDKPIRIVAETPGEVFIEGQSFVKFGGEYLSVSGLHFRNGYTPKGALIEFRIDKNTIANNCEVTNCVIEDFNQLNRYTKDHWVEFWGRYNSLTHCYIAGKTNQGPTVRVNLSGNQHIRNYHDISYNHFGPRPRKGGPRAETMQIGDSYTSMTPSYVMVKNNYFEKCNGEVEVISSKSNFNEFTGNIFDKCEGSLVMRHGNYCLIDGNIFIGDEKSIFNGGIRVINTGHWITNNYFYKLQSDEFRAPLAVMNGIPKSPLNRYNQVTDVVVAYNTWVDCVSPWQFGVGANNDKKDVLPASEIRSARALRTILANNLVYNHTTDTLAIKKYDEIDGVSFKNNVLVNAETESIEGITSAGFGLEMKTDWLYTPVYKAEALMAEVYDGFGFESITKDLFGKSRGVYNSVGAITAPVTTQEPVIDKAKYGAPWYTGKPAPAPSVVHSVILEAGDLEAKLAAAASGDVLELAIGEYEITASLVINKAITLRSKADDERALILYTGPEDSPAFEMNPGGELTLQNVVLQGKDEQIAFAPLAENMSGAYYLSVENTNIKDFDYITKAYRGSFADTIKFTDSRIEDSEHGIVLAAEVDDKGDYNAEFLFIEGCEFDNIKQNVINYYRGGYDESTIGGNLLVSNSEFINCGRRESDNILLKSRGIINVNITGNTFRNNSIRYISILWGEKNNRESENERSRSGSFRTEQHMKQKLMY